MDYSDSIYSPKELEKEYKGLSPQEVYTRVATERHAKLSKTVLRLLSPIKDDWYSLVVLDLSHSYIGNNGVTVTCEVCKVLSNLRRIDLSNNFLDNGSVWAICHVAFYHPTLQELELRQNAGITWTAAMCLAELSLRNSNIIYIGLSETSVPWRSMEDIFGQTRLNAIAKMVVRQSNLKRPKCPYATSLRSVKASFVELENESGVVETSRALRLLESVGVRLALELEETDLHTVDLPPRVSWEMFLIKVIKKCNTFSEEVVDRLRKVFYEFCYSFDVTPLVMVSEMERVFCRIYNHPITAEAKLNLEEKLDLTEVMAIDWDEFLLLFYNTKVPEINLVGACLTPVPTERNILHF